MLKLFLEVVVRTAAASEGALAAVFFVQSQTTINIWQINPKALN
jgi:hypothetical protein